LTAVSYPDRRATSEDGRFTLEAVSSHNGTIDHRDGRRPTDNEYAFKYRQKQREFRYRLPENRGSDPAPGSSGRGPERIVWERSSSGPMEGRSPSSEVIECGAPLA